MASLITIKTYQARTGVVLAEDSYDLTVKENGASKDAPHGRIFAGGIGTGADGQPRFLLRVYDALDGKFLWEGELNLTSQKEERRARPIATVTPTRPSIWKASVTKQSSIRVSFALRAVDLRTGRLVWEDKFIPGSPRSRQAERTRSWSGGRSLQAETTGHVFDLVVRAFDQSSGRLLWQDSFEEASHIGQAESDGKRRLEPQMAPFQSDKRRGRTDL